jgi:hypothetical protein
VVVDPPKLRLTEHGDELVEGAEDGGQDGAEDGECGVGRDDADPGDARVGEDGGVKAGRQREGEMLQRDREWGVAIRIDGSGHG